MFVQVFAALASGVITDKLGRKRTTHLFDIVSWSIPCLIWAFSQNFTHFLIAAVINGLWRVAEPGTAAGRRYRWRQLVRISWIHIAGLVPLSPVTGFYCPLRSVPTSGSIISGIVMMTVKSVLGGAENPAGQIGCRKRRSQPLDNAQ